MDSHLPRDLYAPGVRSRWGLRPEKKTAAPRRLRGAAVDAPAAGRGGPARRAAPGVPASAPDLDPLLGDLGDGAVDGGVEGVGEAFGRRPGDEIALLHGLAHL